MKTKPLCYVLEHNISCCFFINLFELLYIFFSHPTIYSQHNIYCAAAWLGTNTLPPRWQKMFGTEPTCVAVCPRPAGDGVPVLRHHTGHHTVLQLLPAEFLDALHPGHGHGRRPAAAPAQVQVSARRRTLHKSKHQPLDRTQEDPTFVVC